MHKLKAALLDDNKEQLLKNPMARIFSTKDCKDLQFMYTKRLKHTNYNNKKL
ncbi:MAG: hypothetical protein H7Z76_14235 [Methylotenera sp.]|nr:hypothetical protein [Flavobacterium sp.]